MISDPLEQIRKRFAERCRGDLDRLRALRASGVYLDDAGQMSVLVGIAHSLAGTGGTLGFPDVSSRAFEVETTLIERQVDDRTIAALDRLIQALEVVAASAR